MMAKINWGAGLQRVFIAFCAIWAIGTALAMAFGVSSYISYERKVPDKTWILWNATTDDTPVIVFAKDQIDAKEFKDEYVRRRANPNTVDPSLNSPIELPETVKIDQWMEGKKTSLVIAEGGDWFVFPADPKDEFVIKTLTRYFTQVHDRQIKQLHKDQWEQRGQYLIISAITFGILCAIIFSIRWIVLGFRTEKA